MSDAKRGNCPICGQETDGIHIAGSVYDFQCEDCADEAHANFRSFVDRLIDEAVGDTPEAEK